MNEHISTTAVRQILKNSRWEVQYCTPDTFSESDQQRCIDFLEEYNWLNEPKVNDYVQSYSNDIVAEYEYHEGELSLNQFAAYWIGDSLASELLPEDCYYPDSATFIPVEI